jgi:uncharacterized RDD family membrane protein YckC
LTRVIDAGVCVTLLRRRRLRTALALAAAYHVAGWTFGGTLGGLVAATRVVSVDGSGVLLGQALVKLVAGDEIAGTETVSVR